MSPSETRRLGFTIRDFFKPRDWRLLEIDASIPFAAQEECPCDGTALKTLCTLVGQNGRQRIRVGGCPSCGYIGYRDRPVRQWVHNFYFQDWDKADEVDVAAEIEKRKKLLSAGYDKKDRRAIEMRDIIERYGLVPSRPVLDIGCGYGEVLGYFASRGFTKLIGIENSTHRARVAHAAYGVETITSPFEDAETQKILKAYVPFQFIFSHHVLEHVYDPREIIGRASALQQSGDYLVIAVPHRGGEPAMQTLLYLPHLHTYTKEALARLLNAHQYEVVDDSRTSDLEIHLVARKAAAPVAPTPVSGFPFDEAVKKFVVALGMGRTYMFSQRLLWWYRSLGFDIGGQLPYVSYAVRSRAFKKHYIALTSRLIKRKYDLPSPVQSCIISDLDARYTSYEESPLEIQFDGNILLAYK